MYTVNSVHHIYSHLHIQCRKFATLVFDASMNFWIPNGMRRVVKHLFLHSLRYGRNHSGIMSATSKIFTKTNYKITYCNINCMNNVQLLNVLEPMRIFIKHFPFATLIQMKLDTFQCLLSYCKAGVWVKKLINILIHTKTINNLELKSNESYVVSTVSFPYYSKL